MAGFLRAEPLNRCEEELDSKRDGGGDPDGFPAECLVGDAEEGHDDEGGVDAGEDGSDELHDAGEFECGDEEADGEGG